MRHPFANEKQQRVGPPLAWAIAVAVIASVFAVAAIIANFGPLNSASQQQAVRTELPAARYESIAALIKATGNACSRVCSIEASPSFAGTSSLNVACLQQDRGSDCATPTRYIVAVKPAD